MYHWRVTFDNGRTDDDRKRFPTEISGVARSFRAADRKVRRILRRRSNWLRTEIGPWSRTR